MATVRQQRKISPPSSTRERIEREAITIMSDKGYEATSMREIAEASGVTKPVIYYYFKSKENLCLHLIRSGLEKLRQSLKEICEDQASDVFEQIVCSVQVRFDFCEANVELMRFIYALNFGPDRKRIDYDFYSYGLEIFEMQAALIRRAADAGIIKKGKEEATVYYLRGIITTYVMLYVDGHGEFPSGLARTIVSDMVNGLRA